MFSRLGGPPADPPPKDWKKGRKKEQKRQKLREASLSHYASKLHSSLFFSFSRVCLSAARRHLNNRLISISLSPRRRKIDNTHTKLRQPQHREGKTHNMDNVFVFSFILLFALFFICASLSPPEKKQLRENIQASALKIFWKSLIRYFKFTISTVCCTSRSRKSQRSWKSFWEVHKVLKFILKIFQSNSTFSLNFWLYALYCPKKPAVTKSLLINPIQLYL